MVQIYLYLRIVRAKYDAENIFAQIYYGLQCSGWGEHVMDILQFTTS